MYLLIALYCLSGREDAVEDIVSTKPGGKQLKHIGKLQEGAKDHDRMQNVGNATTAGLSDEEGKPHCFFPKPSTPFLEANLSTNFQYCSLGTSHRFF